MVAFTQNLLDSQKNLVRDSQNNKKWPKIRKTQTVAKKRISTLSVV